MAPPSKKRKRVADLDSLPWTMDENGVATLEGVEIIRNGDQVEFLVPANLAKRAKQAKQAKQDRGQDGEDVQAEEWDGFGESDTEENSAATASINGQTTTTTTTTTTNPRKDENESRAAKKTKTTKKAKTAKTPAKDTPLPLAAKPNGTANAFALLDTVDGEEDAGADTSAWQPLSLNHALLGCISRLRFESPTPIQSAAIPEIISGHDVIGKASTGSGKTLAFAIPIVERWLERREERDSQIAKEEDADVGKKRKLSPIALVLSPTRELAHQITKHMANLVESLPESPYVVAVTGGLSITKQRRQLEKADIVVATPGRLWEVLEGSGDSGALLETFRKIDFLVVDEADRLLSEGHFKEAEDIIAALDKVMEDEDEDEDDDDDETLGEDKVGSENEQDEKDNDGERRRNKRQTLVFSATFNKGLQQRLAGKRQYDLLDDRQSMEYLLKKLNFREEHPRFIDVNPVSQMADKLREGLVECGAMEKDLFLYATILLSGKKRILVFTNSIGAVRRLSPLLQLLNIPAHSLHSQMGQKARLRAIERFRAPPKQDSRADTKGPSLTPMPAVLVATDVAARGLDIPNVDAVIHYHVPRTADAYVHRSGRTARGASSGISVLLCCPEEVVPIRRLAAKVHSKNEATGTKRGYVLQTIDIDRRISSRLRERVVLAKQISDATTAKERGHKEDDWVRAAANELGVDVEEIEARKAAKLGRVNRGSGRQKKEDEARGMSKAELGAMRAQLRDALSRRVNTGVSERYVAGGGTVDLSELLRDGVGGGLFLGKVDGLDL